VKSNLVPRFSAALHGVEYLAGPTLRIHSVDEAGERCACSVGEPLRGGLAGHLDRFDGETTKDSGHDRDGLGVWVNLAGGCSLLGEDALGEQTGGRDWLDGPVRKVEAALAGERT
jgi:hypothetical protein